MLGAKLANTEENDAVVKFNTLLLHMTSEHVTHENALTDAFCTCRLNFVFVKRFTLHDGTIKDTLAEVFKALSMDEFTADIDLFMKTLLKLVTLIILFA